MAPLLLPNGLQTRGHIFWVAENSEGADVAFIWIGIALPGIPPGARFLFDIVVRPEHRREGYARHVLTRLLAELAGDRTESVILQTRADNAPALALYGSLGFTRTETSEDGKQVQMMLRLAGC